MPLYRLILLSTLMPAACAPAQESQAPAGAVADSLERSERRAASDKAADIRDADARAADRADRAVERIAESGRERRRAAVRIEQQSRTADDRSR